MPLYLSRISLESCSWRFEVDLSMVICLPKLAFLISLVQRPLENAAPCSSWAGFSKEPSSHRASQREALSSLEPHLSVQAPRAQGVGHQCILTLYCYFSLRRVCGAAKFSQETRV